VAARKEFVILRRMARVMQSSQSKDAFEMRERASQLLSQSRIENRIPAWSWQYRGRTLPGISCSSR